MEEPWNQHDLQPPPFVTIPCARNDIPTVLLKCAASSANDVQATIQDLTDSPNKRQLNSEVLLISRMIYRCTNNLGGHKAIQGLQKVKKCLERLQNIDLEGLLKPLGEELDMLAAVLTSRSVYIQSSACLKYLLNRLMGTSALLGQTALFCMHTFIHAYEVLSIGNFIPNMLVFMALMSRVRVLCLHMLGQLIQCYNHAYGLLLHVYGVQAEEKLPEDLDTWLKDQGYSTSVAPHLDRKKVNSLESLKEFLGNYCGRPKPTAAEYTDLMDSLDVCLYWNLELMEVSEIDSNVLCSEPNALPAMAAVATKCLTPATGTTGCLQATSMHKSFASTLCPSSQPGGSSITKRAETIRQCSVRSLDCFGTNEVDSAAKTHMARESTNPNQNLKQLVSRLKYAIVALPRCTVDGMLPLLASIRSVFTHKDEEKVQVLDELAAALKRITRKTPNALLNSQVIIKKETKLVLFDCLRVLERPFVYERVKVTPKEEELEEHRQAMHRTPLFKLLSGAKTFRRSFIIVVPVTGVEEQKAQLNAALDQLKRQDPRCENEEYGVIQSSVQGLGTEATFEQIREEILVFVDNLEDRYMWEMRGDKCTQHFLVASQRKRFNMARCRILQNMLKWTCLDMLINLRAVEEIALEYLPQRYIELAKLYEVEDPEHTILYKRHYKLANEFFLDVAKLINSRRISLAPETVTQSSKTGKSSNTGKQQKNVKIDDGMDDPLGEALEQAGASKRKHSASTKHAADEMDKGQQRMIECLRHIKITINELHNYSSGYELSHFLENILSYIPSKMKKLFLHLNNRLATAKRQRKLTRLRKAMSSCLLRSCRIFEVHLPEEYRTAPEKIRPPKSKVEYVKILEQTQISKKLFTCVVPNTNPKEQGKQLQDMLGEQRLKMNALRVNAAGYDSLFKTLVHMGDSSSMTFEEIRRTIIVYLDDVITWCLDEIVKVHLHNAERLQSGIEKNCLDNRGEKAGKKQKID